MAHVRSSPGINYWIRIPFKVVAESWPRGQPIVCGHAHSASLPQEMDVKSVLGMRRPIGYFAGVEHSFSGVNVQNRSTELLLVMTWKVGRAVNARRDSCCSPHHVQGLLGKRGHNSI